VLRMLAKVVPGQWQMLMTLNKTAVSGKAWLQNITFGEKAHIRLSNVNAFVGLGRNGNKVVQLGLSGDINIKMGQATVTIAAAGSFSSVDQTLVLRLNSSALIPRVLGIKALSFQNVGGELQLTPAAPFMKQLSLNATVLLGTDPMWAIKVKWRLLSVHTNPRPRISVCSSTP